MQLVLVENEAARGRIRAGLKAQGVRAQTRVLGFLSNA